MCMCMQKLKIFESLDITQQIKEKTERKVKLLHLLRTVKGQTILKVVLLLVIFYFTLLNLFFILSHFVKDLFISKFP